MRFHILFLVVLGLSTFLKIYSILKYIISLKIKVFIHFDLGIELFNCLSKVCTRTAASVETELFRGAAKIALWGPTPRRIRRLVKI